jgi:translation elongation factor EF-Tu-like GTPase
MRKMIKVVINEHEDNSMTKEDIIDATKVIAAINKPMAELVIHLEACVEDVPAIRGSMADAVSSGANLFEALAKQAPMLADALHDFVYQIALPHNSITAKNIAREQVIKAFLSL